ncbi:hypothetical protein ACFQVA_41725 [Actinomadura keratinilytica]
MPEPRSTASAPGATALPRRLPRRPGGPPRGRAHPGFPRHRPRRRRATRGLLATLALVQAAADAGLDAPVWALTSGAADTTGDGPVPHPEGALVAGLGRALALEDPVRFGGVVDLPAGPHAGLPDDLAGHLVAALAAGDGEDQVAVRADGRYVRRLRRTAPWAPRRSGPPGAPPSSPAGRAPWGVISPGSSRTGAPHTSCSPPGAAS